MPSDFPPWRTIYGFARRWAASGAISVIRDQLRRAVRVGSGKTPQAAAVIVDSQSVKASETVGGDSRGFDGAKLINGRKLSLARRRANVLWAMLRDGECYRASQPVTFAA
ncbi:hypothetical protein GCM10009544_31750 [Streptomyces stramineus]|uniref:Transposase n=1 Tax=Streptomyces stramineus TaxID=173861 RepID=A0ABN1A495_9ACTN